MYDTLVNNISGSGACTTFEITWFATYSVKNNYRGYLKKNFKIYLIKSTQRQLNV